MLPQLQSSERINKYLIPKILCHNPNVAKVEGVVASRRKGYSCSTLPQTLYNNEDAVASAFPQGK